MSTQPLTLDQLKAQIKQLPPEQQRKLGAFVATHVAAKLYTVEPQTEQEKAILKDNA